MNKIQRGHKKKLSEALRKNRDILLSGKKISKESYTDRHLTPETLIKSKSGNYIFTGFDNNKNNYRSFRIEGVKKVLPKKQALLKAAGWPMNFTKPIQAVAKRFTGGIKTVGSNVTNKAVNITNKAKDGYYSAMAKTTAKPIEYGSKIMHRMESNHPILGDMSKHILKDNIMTGQFHEAPYALAGLAGAAVLPKAKSVVNGTRTLGQKAFNKFKNPVTA